MPIVKYTHGALFSRSHLIVPSQFSTLDAMFKSAPTTPQDAQKVASVPLHDTGAPFSKLDDSSVAVVVRDIEVCVHLSIGRPCTSTPRNYTYAIVSSIENYVVAVVVQHNRVCAHDQGGGLVALQAAPRLCHEWADAYVSFILPCFYLDDAEEH